MTLEVSFFGIWVNPNVPLENGPLLCNSDFLTTSKCPKKQRRKARLATFRHFANFLLYLGYRGQIQNLIVSANGTMRSFKYTRQSAESQPERV